MDVNESFDAREEASLTFIAGDFRDSSLRVIQKGSAFLVEQPYLISPRTEKDYELAVTTRIGTEWDAEYDEWINVEEVNRTSDEDTKTLTLKIWAADNGGDSRYGHISLNTSGESYVISLFQFGNDYQYDANGNIFFPKDQDAEVRFIAPKYAINQINVPDYASTSTTENEDGTLTFTIDFAANATASDREISVSLLLNNAGATTDTLPKMIQQTSMTEE